MMSSTADGGGDGSEFIVLTNISDSVAADLAGLRITCAKAGGKAPSLDLTLDEGTIPAGGSLILTKAANWPAAKITNGKVDIVVTDVAGETVQTLYVDASWWGKACDGTGAHFIAADFGPSVTTDAQWTPSFLPSADEAVKAVGIEWAVEQCRELMAHGVPSIHFYTVSAVDSIAEIARRIY